MPALSGVPALATPFDRVHARRAHTSVEVYAALRAELAAQPDQIAAILLAYGIDGREGCEAIEIAWQRRFEREPATREQFTAAVTRLWRER